MTKVDRYLCKMEQELIRPKTVKSDFLHNADLFNKGQLIHPI